jgi:hypothetical protein
LVQLVHLPHSAPKLTTPSRDNNFTRNALPPVLLRLFGAPASVCNINVRHNSDVSMMAMATPQESTKSNAPKQCWSRLDALLATEYNHHSHVYFSIQKW